MPLLLRCAMVVSSLMGAGFALFFVIFLIIILVGHGPFDLNGAIVTRRQFVAGSSSFLFVSLPALAAYFGSMAFALIRERAWSRPLLAGFFPMNALVLLVDPLAMKLQALSEDDRIVVAEIAAFSLVGFWYLYRRRSVVAYYRALRLTESSSSP